MRKVKGKLKYEPKFYDTVNAMCRDGSIAAISDALHQQWPMVPATSLVTYIGRARHFGDCKKDFPKTGRRLARKLGTDTNAEEQTFRKLSPEQIDKSVWRMLAQGHEAIIRNKVLEDKCAAMGIEIEKLKHQISVMVENAHKQLSSDLAEREHLIKKYGEPC
jgi:hypothetical protein